MNDQHSAERFDFSKPSGFGDDKSERLHTWTNAFCATFAERWNQVTKFDVKLQIESCDVYTFENSKTRLPKPAVGHYLSFGEPSIRCLLVLDQSLSLAVVCQLMGEELDEMPTGRFMTAVEENLFEVFVSNITDSLSEAWPEKDPLACHPNEIDYEPHRCRMLGPREIVLFCKIKINICGADSEFYWLIPHGELELMLSSTDEDTVQPRQHSKSELEKLASMIPVDVSMTLGTCKVSVAALFDLQVGDILVLDQPISEPMPISVGNKNKFVGWLGRNKNKQAYKISGFDVMGENDGRSQQ